MANIFVAATATFNGKALKKGKKEISVFDEQVKKLGKTFAGVFGAQKLLAFSKKAVAAFMADEKAAKSLEVQLRNTGFQFSAPGVENYIGNLQRLSGVLDDELRPAFQQLLTVTGSVTKSQSALQTALDVSAATGRSLTQVSAALTRGFSGNTAGLSRLGAGISKATLKTGDMDKILGELNKKFAGQAAARLDTYAGKMSLLTVATEDAKETIGKGLLDALSLLGKDTSISSATKLMDDFATSTADAVVGIALLVNELKKLGNTKVGGVLFDVKNIPVLGAYLAGFSEIGAAERAKTAPSNREGRSASRIYLDQLRKESKALQTATTLRKQENAQLKAKTEIDKLSEKFDTERIGLMKALGEATDAETKLRIQSKLAILDNNEALAKKYLAELNAAKSVTDLTAAFNGSSLDLKSIGETLARLKGTLPDVLARVQAGAAAREAGTYTSPANTPLNLETVGETLDRLKTTLPDLLERVQARAATFDRSDTYIPSSAMPSGVPTTTTAPVINVNVEGSLTSLQEFETTIQDLLLKIYKQNGDLAPAGFIQ
jgi:hypothetical protein